MQDLTWQHPNQPEQEQCTLDHEWHERVVKAKTNKRPVFFCFWSCVSTGEALLWKPNEVMDWVTDLPPTIERLLSHDFQKMQLLGPLAFESTSASIIVVRRMLIVHRSQNDANHFWRHQPGQCSPVAFSKGTVKVDIDTFHNRLDLLAMELEGTLH